MIPNKKLRLVESQGVGASAEFGISSADSAHIMTILRDTLYSDKVLAVLREYSSNAWDAHRMFGKADVPIKVTLPTVMDPTLTIRDFGPGLSENDVFQVYTQYGASTKRDSDTAVGMLGIGSKSGFAYSDSFTITSYHGGKKRTYVAVLDKTEKGVIQHLHEEDCGDETGVAIQIAVRPDDIKEFHDTAQNLFKFFNPRPDINIEIPPLPRAQLELKHGVLWDTVDEKGNYVGKGDGWVAVMGCVSYRINLAQLRTSKSGTEEGLAQFVEDISGALFFDIGDVRVSASREELKYDQHTKATLIDKFNKVIDDYVLHTLRNIENGNLSPWERRVQAQVLSAMKLPVPEEYKDLVASHVPLQGKEKPKTFFVVQFKDQRSSVTVSEHARLILSDDHRALAGFRITGSDYLVKRIDKADWDDVRKELDEVIVANGLQGLPVVKLSSLPWIQPRKLNGRTSNEKHKQRTFVFNPKEGSGYYRPLSRYWTAEDRAPTTDDVYVILEAFEPESGHFYRDYAQDAEMAEFFGGKMPTVYGYKTTAKKPVREDPSLGTVYDEWRKSFHRSLLSPEVERIMAFHSWSELDDDNRYSWRYYAKTWDDTAKKMRATYRKLLRLYGKGHDIVEIYENIYRANAFLAWVAEEDSNIPERVKQLKEATEELIGEDIAQAAVKELHSKYPLLKAIDLQVLWGSHAKEWADYVHLIDRITAPIFEASAQTASSPLDDRSTPVSGEATLQQT